MNKILKLIIISLVPFAATANAGEETEKSIVDVAIEAPQFSTLVAAVVKAELVEVLDGHRQFTVFAPDNEAFTLTAKAVLGDPNATGIDLVNSLDVETLTQILLYHVAPGERYSGDVTSSSRIRTMSKDFLFVNGTVLDGFASSAALDLGGLNIDAKNGVIHTIEYVLLP